jgi:hypothetical protein
MHSGPQSRQLQVLVLEAGRKLAREVASVTTRWLTSRVFQEKPVFLTVSQLLVVEPPLCRMLKSVHFGVKS